MTDAERAAADHSVNASLERVLAHAESHGEVYPGATEDHATLRAAIEDGGLPGDKRLDPPADPGNADTPPVP